MVQPASVDSDERLTFVFEVCRNCDDHQWHTKHDEEKYQSYFEKVSALIKEELPDSECMLNRMPITWPGRGLVHDGYKKIYPRLGAFEIITRVKRKYIVLHSKKKTLEWPDLSVFIPAIQRFAKKKDTAEAEDLQRDFGDKNQEEGSNEAL